MRVASFSNHDLVIGLRSLPDDELLRRLAELLRRSRRNESELIAHIGEVDQRRLYAREAVPSMFEYCTDVLHLSEHEAYLRITVARAARDVPVLLEMLADGRLHLSGIAKLVPHLTDANRQALLDRAVHKSKREICELVAELAPRPDAPALIRKQPEPRLAPIVDSPAAPAAAPLELGPDRVPPPPLPPPSRPAVMQPLSPSRYLVQFTASATLRAKLQRLQALMRHSVPDGDLAAIIEAAVTDKLRRLEARRFGRTSAPRKSLANTETKASASRYIPAAVRRIVHARDRGRCRYLDDRGRRCRARRDLQFHHVEAHARGGDCSPDNIRLMCRSHNVYLAEKEYGRDLMARYRSPRAGPAPQRASR